jgi:uncharacterized protein YdaT
MPRNNRHVSQTPDNRWAVKDEGAKRASNVYDTQREAQNRAKEIVQRHGGGEVITHGMDGKIRDSVTIPPGHDPFLPRDKK